MVDICMPQASTFDICTFQDSPAARVSITRSSHEMAHLHPSRHPPTVPISLRSVSTCCQLPGVDLRSGVAVASSNKAFGLPSTRLAETTLLEIFPIRREHYEPSCSPSVSSLCLYGRVLRIHLVKLVAHKYDVGEYLLLWKAIGGAVSDFLRGSASW